MKILIAGLVSNSQLTRLQEEGSKRGHTVEGCLSTDLALYADGSGFLPLLQDKDISSYDLIYLWAVSKRRWEWYVACEYVSTTHGVQIVNRKILDTDYLYFLSPASDYLKQVNEGIVFPKSAVILSSNSLLSVIDKFSFPLILKTSAGRQGKGVFKVDSYEELVAKVKELKETSLSFVIREFIPNDGDIRVFTVGYKAIGAMKRTPATEGEFRSNISQGGMGAPFDLTASPKIREIAEKMSMITRTEIAGVDIMIHRDSGEAYVLEINPGPQFTGLEKFTEANAALEIIKYFETLNKV